MQSHCVIIAQIIGLRRKAKNSNQDILSAVDLNLQLGKFGCAATTGLPDHMRTDLAIAQLKFNSRSSLYGRLGYWKATGPSGSARTNWLTNGSFDSSISAAFPSAMTTPSWMKYT